MKGKFNTQLPPPYQINSSTQKQVNSKSRKFGSKITAYEVQRSLSLKSTAKHPTTDLDSPSKPVSVKKKSGAQKRFRDEEDEKQVSVQLSSSSTSTSLLSPSAIYNSISVRPDKKSRSEMVSDYEENKSEMDIEASFDFLAESLITATEQCPPGMTPAQHVQQSHPQLLELFSRQVNCFKVQKVLAADHTIAIGDEMQNQMELVSLFYGSCSRHRQADHESTYRMIPHVHCRCCVCLCVSLCVCVYWIRKRLPVNPP